MYKDKNKDQDYIVLHVFYFCYNEWFWNIISIWNLNSIGTMIRNKVFWIYIHNLLMTYNTFIYTRILELMPHTKCYRYEWCPTPSVRSISDAPDQVLQVWVMPQTMHARYEWCQRPCVTGMSHAPDPVLQTWVMPQTKCYRY